jgi:hypothetical protein
VSPAHLVPGRVIPHIISDEHPWSRKWVYADHVVQVRVAVPVSVLSPVLLNLPLCKWITSRQAIGNSTNSLRQCSFHNIHRVVCTQCVPLRFCFRRGVPDGYD